MKKFLLSILLGLAAGFMFPVFADDITEDYLDIAANYCVVGDYNSAIVYLDKILQADPNNKQAGDLKRGLQHILSNDKKSYVTGVNPLIKQAQEYKRVGDERMEVITLMQAAQSENSYLAHYFLGNYFRDKRNYIKAIDEYNSALSARADFAQAYLATAATLLDIGRYEAVINPIDKYLTFVPNDDLAYAIKSRAEFELGMIEQSKADNDKAIEINNCPEYQFDRAKILYKNDDYQNAKILFTELLPEMQTSKIYEYIALCDYAMENYMSALLNLDKAIILSDDDVYLENKYNEIKQILESNKNEQTEE